MFRLILSPLVSGPASVNRITGRRKRENWRLAAGLAMALFALLAATAGAAVAAGGAVRITGSRFETGPCPFPSGAIPAGVRVDCGNLIVPEDRARTDGASISLAVAMIRSPNPSPAPDPILFLADGPGGSGLDWLGYFTSSAPDLRADRDIILLDQRGTGHSQPSLACFEFDSLERAARARQLSLAQAQELDLQTAVTCHDRLAAAGVQLSAYTTAASAADIQDLRLALGYLQWNLYGLGYGTRLALSVLRDFPGGVRSVVLDSAQPPQAARWETSAANANRAFSALFAACGLQPACDAAYPGLGLKFAEAIDRLQATPVSVQIVDPLTGSPSPVLFTGRTLVAGVAATLAGARDLQGFLPYLPMAIAQLDAGNLATAEAFATRLAAGPEPMHSGLWYVVQCHDEAPFNNPARIQADANAFPRLRDFVLGDTTLAVCPAWGVGQADAREKQPVRSEVPALVVAGEFDPIQPPVWSQLAASTLQHSTYYLLPGVGHGASLQGCGQVLVVQFIADPSLGPNPVCVSGARAPTFASEAYLNPGIQRLAASLVLHFDLIQALPFLVCGAVFGSALLLWPLAALFQRRGPRRAGFARWLATLTVLLDLLFAGALIALIVLTNQQQPGLLLFGLPPETAPLFAVPWVAAVLTAGLLWLTVLAWKDGYWTLAGRVHYTLVAAAAAGFLWLLYHWGVVGLS